MAKAAAAAASAVKMLLPLSSARKCWTEVTKRLAKLAKQDQGKTRQNNWDSETYVSYTKGKLEAQTGCCRVSRKTDSGHHHCILT